MQYKVFQFFKALEEIFKKFDHSNENYWPVFVLPFVYVTFAYSTKFSN